ncbi:MAG: hypothetical protein O3B73_19205, partial [bacterium]|nr:hypothetical protein [bacterium]
METILVSEKEPHMRQLLEWELEDSNYLCVCVDSTHGAKIALLLERIDAVVLGIGWPAADDLDTLRLLKKS